MHEFHGWRRKLGWVAIAVAALFLGRDEFETTSFAIGAVFAILAAILFLWKPRTREVRRPPQS